MTEETSKSMGSIRAGMNIDEGKLTSYLSTILLDFKAPLTVKQFKFGQSNPTYFLTDASGKRYVLRKKPPGELISKKAHQVEREHQILHALGTKTDVPVPRVFALCEDSGVVGTPFYVMEFLDGRIFTDNDLPSVAVEDRRAYYNATIDTLSKLHRAPYTLPTLKNYGRPGDFYLRQMTTLVSISRMQASVTDDQGKTPVPPIPRLKEMLAWFKRNAVADEVSIVHGDFKVDNVVFHPVAPRVIGVLDWEL
ncbi:hypothetical protein HDV05_002148 [Chytridiales sp. JEL 0842]|nr:hypothetical protein HDV05_002148 [Chytridiales sp. JEL 0842]